MRGSSRRMTIEAISKSAGSPALFCWPRLWPGNRFFFRFGLRCILLRCTWLFGFGFRSDLARRRLLRTFRGQQWRNRGQRVVDIPLANPVAAASLREVEVDVVLVIPVRSWPQHRGEARAYRLQHGLALPAR